jgi:GT2 family glycosyltransferase
MIDFELIIVDNGSTQDVKDFLKKLELKYSFIKVITNNMNKGYAYACNQGIKLAMYKFICMLDADTIVAPYWLPKMLRCMYENEKCGIIVPTQQALEDMPYAKFIENKKLNIFENVNEFAETLKDGYETREIFHLYGFCHLVRKEVYDQIGVYDWRRYYKVAVNETDLFWRATQKGWDLGWAKGAYVHHFHSKIKQNIGLDSRAMVDKGNKIFNERIKEIDNIFVNNDAEIGY